MIHPPPLGAADLDDRILARLYRPDQPTVTRLLGVEYERLLLHRETQQSAPVEFARELLAALAAGLGAEPVDESGVVHRIRAPDWSISLEPGGQLEVAVAPRRSLADVDALLAHVDGAVQACLQGTVWQPVALGHAPVTPVEEIDLLPRRRYQIMDGEMPARGALSRSMMRATAGLQVAFDVGDRADASAKLALLFRLSPVLLALSANSRRAAGADTGFASWRHRIWLDTDTSRGGVPDGCLDPEQALAAYVRFARRAVVLFVTRNGTLHPAPRASLEQLVATGSVRITDADLDLHLSSLFPFVRPRGYLEVRCFDSLPWPTARALVALSAGLVYCATARAGATELSARLVPVEEQGWRALHEAAAREGLAARAPDGTPFRELATELLRLAAGALGRADCSYATPADLEPLHARLAAG